MFITFEGIDGSGKTTQAKLLYDFIIKRGLPAILTKEPTDYTHAAQKIRKILNGEVKITHQKIQLLFNEDRKEHLKTVIEPALRAGKIVICDRYILSTLAYGSLGCDAKWLLRISEKFTRPNITFLIDVSPDWALERLQKRSKPLETIYEKKSKLEKIRKAYLEAAKIFPDTYLILSEKPIKKVYADILKIIKTKLQ